MICYSFFWCMSVNMLFRQLPKNKINHWNGTYRYFIHHRSLIFTLLLLVTNATDTFVIYHEDTLWLSAIDITCISIQVKKLFIKWLCFENMITIINKWEFGKSSRWILFHTASFLRFLLHIKSENNMKSSE